MNRTVNIIVNNFRQKSTKFPKTRGRSQVPSLCIYTCTLRASTCINICPCIQVHILNMQECIGLPIIFFQGVTPWLQIA
jgi:hypothetical protein